MIVSFEQISIQKRTVFISFGPEALLSERSRVAPFVNFRPLGLDCWELAHNTGKYPALSS